jgi:hypothetical protein
LEALPELIFYTKPPNFGVDAYMEAFAGVALRRCKIGVRRLATLAGSLEAKHQAV